MAYELTLTPDAGQPVCTDTVLLAEFTRLAGVKKAADFGAGAGTLAVLLASRAPALTVDCVELRPDAAELCRRNIEQNGLSGRLRVLCRDLRTLTEAEVGKYQLIAANPPYHPPGHGAPPADEARRTAREERSCTLPELAESAARLLGDGGRLTLVYPASRLAEAMCALSAAKLEPKRLRLVQSTVEKPPSLALLECVRRGRPGLTVEPVWIIDH